MLVRMFPTLAALEVFLLVVSRGVQMKHIRLLIDKGMPPLNNFYIRGSKL